MMSRIVSMVLVGCFLCIPLGLAENWPQWRGPRGDSTTAERDLPIVWGEDRGLVWKCPLPSWGNSTPAISGGGIFVTSHEDDRRLLLLRIDKTTGKILVDGNHVRVTLNGVVIVDAVTEHPALKKAQGPIGFKGHHEHVEFRNLRIKELPANATTSKQ